MNLCESRVIHKNPKYRIIQYGDSYYLVDLASNWLSYIFPMINWFIPKKCAEISKEEVEQLNIVKPVKNNAASWVGGGGICIAVGFRKYISLFDIQLDTLLAIISCVISLISIFIFFIYLNKKLSLQIYERNIINHKIILLPTLKNIFLMLSSYIIFGGVSALVFYALTIEGLYNIFIYFLWTIITAFFFFLNMFSINDTKVRAKLITKEIEK